jgi:hypothetical protein
MMYQAYGDAARFEKLMACFYEAARMFRASSQLPAVLRLTRELPPSGHSHPYSNVFGGSHTRTRGRS